MAATQQTSHRLGNARFGALAWVLGAIQSFVCYLIVQSAWTRPYSWSLNMVSDLGRVHCQCASAGARYVCSPLHNLMNVSTIMEGILIVAGAIMIGSLWRRTAAARVARGLLIVAGLAIVIVGLAPADVNENLHMAAGAVPVTILGNSGLILTGLALESQIGKARMLGPVIGGVGLIATGLFLSRHYLGLGVGGMERLAVLNLPIWTLLTGVHLFVNVDKRDRIEDHLSLERAMAFGMAGEKLVADRR